MKNPILRSMLWSAACLLLTVSASSAKSPERTSGYVGIRPLPRSAGESKIDWMSGIGYYDSLLRPDDFTAKYTDVIKDYRGAFATRKCFFEHYLPLDRDWIDMNPETNPLILKIRSREKIGMEVEHILICREAELLGRGKWGPFKEDSRILYQRDVDDYRKLFKLAYKQGLTKHKNYKLIQMVTHASAFMEIPEAVKIVKTMDGIAYESHQFNRHWPYETGWTGRSNWSRVPGGRWIRGWNTSSTTGRSSTRSSTSTRISSSATGCTGSGKRDSRNTIRTCTITSTHFPMRMEPSGRSDRSRTRTPIWACSNG